MSELIREIAERSSSGVLRISQGSTTRFIHFSAGAPVLATSNLASEQVEYRLLRENRTTPSLIERARSKVTDSRDLGRTLVEMGLVTRDVITQASRELSAQIIFSLFETFEGDYAFEEGEPSNEPSVFGLSAADCILQGARLASANQWMLDAKAPLDRMVTRVDIDTNSFTTAANLSSIESYVLSRITSSTPVAEVGDLTGLPEEDARRALCVLVSLGLLESAQKVAAPAPPPPPEPVKRPKPVPQAAQVRPPKPIPIQIPKPLPLPLPAPVPQAPQNVQSSAGSDPLLEGISRKLSSFETADYYQILGVTKLAPITQISEAFHGLESMFTSYKLAHPDNIELQKKLNVLFAKIEEAHHTLSDPKLRWAYDQPSQPRRPPAATRSPVFPQMPRNGDSMIERGQTPTREGSGPLKAPTRKPLPEPTFAFSASSEFERGQAASAMGPPPSAGIPSSSGGQFQVSDSTQPGTFNPAQGALHFYRQGRAKFDQHDLHMAEHLLREACKLDPGQPHYHYHLGVTLMILSQARHSHSHHEGCHVTCKMGGTLVSNPRIRYEAERHFLKALELDPANIQIMVRLGVLYKEARLYKKAEHFFRQTLMVDGKNATAIRELEALEQEGQLESQLASGSH